MATSLINAFSWRGTTVADVLSDVFYINSTETNGSLLSMATNFAITGGLDAVLTIYAGNAEDNLNKLLELDLDANPTTEPFNLTQSFKYIQLGITMNAATEITYKADAQSENSKTRN